MKKRILSILLAALLIFSLLPLTVSATESVPVTATVWNYDDVFYDVYLLSKDNLYLFELLGSTGGLTYGTTYTYADMYADWVCTLDEVGHPLVMATDATLTVTKDESDLIHIVATMTLNGKVHSITYNEVTPAATNTAGTWSALQDAITAATGTTTIQLTENLTAPAEGGAAITVPEGKDITLDLNGKVIDASGKFNAITVAQGGKLTLTDSAPTTVHKFSVNGETGLWTLNESATQDYKTVTGGVITGGTGMDCGESYGTNGGGVYVNGTFNMTAGNIVGNMATGSDDGQYNGFGGGVSVDNGGTFTMTGGTISGNVARAGGGVIGYIGAFTMSGGTISGNTASNSGGGVYNNGTFNMTDGTISDNEAEYGGGVFNNGTLKLLANEGKTITITGNTATNAEGGVANWGEMHLSGKVIINGNNCENTYDDGVNYPKDLATNSPVVIDGALTGSEINITHTNVNNDKHDSGVLFSGFAENNPGAKLDDFFSYNGPSDFNIFVNENGDLMIGKANGVSLPTIKADNDKIKSGDTVVEIKNTNGGNIASEKLDDVAAAINEVLDNYKVNSFDETGLAAATEDNDSSIAEALKAKTTDLTAKNNVNETDINKYLNVTLVSADVDLDTAVTVTSMSFDITPMATITVTGSDGSVTLTTEITNDEIGGTVTFLMPVDKYIAATTAAVYHEGEFIGNYEIKTDGDGNKYIEVTTDSFSEFSYIALNETTAGAKIGDVLYASLSDAIAKVTNNETITLLKDTSGTIMVSREVKFTMDENGKTNTAEIVAGSGYTFSNRENIYAIVFDNSRGSTSDYAVELPATIKNGKIEISPKNASAGQTVTLTVTPDKGFMLKNLTVLNKNGKKLEIKKLGNNTYSFTMPNGNVTIRVTFTKNSFADVKATDYFYDAVLWAAENGITAGIDTTHFAPFNVTTRGQMVTFLWRAAGCPEPTETTCKFTDVKEDDYYFKAVLWAIEQGITKGTSEKTFSPNMNVTRAQAVTFLARMAGVKDDATGYSHFFADIKTTDYYHNAVAWAATNKITEGTDKDTFSPNDDCLRCQIVTFLYRYFDK